MADKYYRLVTFVVNICPLPLRELFITKAKSDQKHHFKDLEDYLKLRKPDIDKLGKRCNSDQLAHIYPANGSVDIQSWDVTLLSLLLRELFRYELQQDERESLTDITDIRNNLQHIANTEFVNDTIFNSSWKGLEKAVITLSRYAGAPSVKHITETIQSTLTQTISHSEDVRHIWYKMLYSDLQSSYLALEKKLESQTAKIESLEGKAEKTSTIMSKVSVKRLGRSGVPEKRIKIVDKKIEKMRDTLNKALTADNDCKESFKNDINMISQHLFNYHRVIVTGHDNRLTYKCALAAILDRNYQRSDQGLEINTPVDWKRISPDDAQFVLFREPFGRTAYDSQKVEVMLEEFDNMLESANADDGENIDIVIVTNQTLLHEVTRRHEHEMLSPVSTFYIDSTADDNQVLGDASPTEETVFSNLIEFSKVYRQSYDRTFIDKSVQSQAERLFLESSAVTIVGPARSGKTGVSFNLLQSYDLSNGEENFVVVMDPGELKYVKFSSRPVILLKLFNGTQFDQMEANKWYRQFDRLHAAVLGKKTAVIIIIESKNFKRWKANMPAHHLLDHLVEMPGAHTAEVEKHENGSADCGSQTEETKCPNEGSESDESDDFKKSREIDYLDPKRVSHDKDENLQKDVDNANEQSNNASQYAERHKTFSSMQKTKPASDSDLQTSLEGNETKEDKLGNEKFYRKDTKVWQRCIDSKDIQVADRLVNERILPDQDLLDRAIDCFGINSSTVKNLCGAICLYLKENFKQIVSVHPAIDFRPNSTKKHITFIIFTAHPSVTDINEYRCYPSCRLEKPSSHPDENMVIKELEENCEKDLSEAEKIREILNKHSKSLMEQHTNITRMSISWVKSKGFGTDNHSKKQKACIAVNVRVKGFVPINEDVLPKTIDGIDVDVREGVVCSYGGPNEHHEYLKMGCAVHSGMRNEKGALFGGTLGGFLEIKGMFFCISCAHIFFSSREMAELKKTHGWCDLGNEIRKFEARQPVIEGSQAFGEGIRAVYNEGGHGKTGVDAVMIKMERRQPISGEFPECPHNRNAGVKHQTFSSGKMYNRDEVKRLIRSKKLTVVKFGWSSGWTRGVLRFDGASVRLNHIVAPYHDFGMLLCNQFEIESIGNTRFAEHGDSGALVFTDENDQLSVIGIVEGGMSGTVFVTPIFEVFDALGLQNVRNMKEFSSTQNKSIHSQGVDHVSSNNSPGSSDIEVETTLKHNLHNSGEDINQGIANHPVKLKHNMQSLFNQEMNQVKLELKSDITKTAAELECAKIELKNEIDKSNAEVKSLIQNQNEILKDILSKLGPQIQNPMTNTANNSLAHASLPNSTYTDQNHNPSNN